MNGIAFLDCAENWMSEASANEPIFRSSVSRAYYGVFHRCATFLTETLQIRVEKGPSRHKKIPLALGYTGNATLVAIGHQLASLRDCRNDADYKIDMPRTGSKQGAELAVRQARRIEQTLASFNATSIEIATMQSGIESAFTLSLTGWSLIRRL